MHKIFYGLLSVLLLYISQTTGDSSYETYLPSRSSDINGDSAEARQQQQHHPPSMLCLNIKPQHSVDIKQITGNWYGNEIIMHTQDVPGIYRYDSCVMINLNDVTDQMRDYYQPSYRRADMMASASAATSSSSSSSSSASLNGQHDAVTNHRNLHMNTRYLRLIWSEKDDNIEYNFNYTMNHPGLWTNLGEQRGSMVALNKYSQFTGTVQVVKAVSDHLVLTFCSSDMHHSIYTIVLSREPQGLSQDIIRGIRSLLSRRGLFTESIRQVCMKSSADIQRSSLITSVLLLVLICILRKLY